MDCKTVSWKNVLESAEVVRDLLEGASKHLDSPGRPPEGSWKRLEASEEPLHASEVPLEASRRRLGLLLETFLRRSLIFDALGSILETTLDHFFELCWNNFGAML